MSYAQRVRGRSPGELEALGKTAARLSETSGLSLTEASVRTLEGQDLSAEQIRRVVEHANINAVNMKFAQMSGGERIVHIDGGPADPLTVIDALNATRMAPGAKLAALEYGTAPVYEERSSYIPDVPCPDLHGLQRKLAAAHDELVDMATGIEFRMEEKFAELERHALAAGREGASLCDLAISWSAIDPTMAKVAVQQLGGKLAWGVKTAGRRIADGHMVNETFRSFAKTASEFHRAVEARRSVEAELAQVSRFRGSMLS